MINLGGRPPKYTSRKEVQRIIDEYFDYCDKRTKEIHSEKLGDMIVPNPEPYTMSGLAYSLGLSRQGLKDYKDSEKFGDIIKDARLRVEADVERRMNDKATFTPGLIFNAKNNFGWKEEAHTDITSQGDKITFGWSEK